MSDPHNFEVTDEQIAYGHAELVRRCEETDAPIVSIIIPTYNNEDQIEQAVLSALDQTLTHFEVIVVDDCSTDRTPEILRALAKRHPHLVLSSTPTNSGGVGGPRNVGMSVARGEYVLFLDGDDTLNRHSAKAMVTAALATGADLTMAQTKRIDARTGAASQWHSSLYKQQTYYPSIEDNPDLVIDSIAVSKLYRADFLRENGFEFLVGVNYEDLIYTARAFAAADGIAVTPEHVYNWFVYPNEVRTTITQQRDTVDNLKQRLHAIETILGELADAHVPNLVRRLFVKLLRHDFKIYLNDLAHGRGRTIADDTLSIMQELLAEVPHDVIDDLTLPERLLYGAVVAGRADIIPDAVRMTWRWADCLGSIDIDNGTARWEREAIDASGSQLARELTAFDAELMTGVPWMARKWLCEVTSVVRTDRRTLRLTAFLHDPLGTLRELPDFACVLTLSERTGMKRRTAIEPRSVEFVDGGVRLAADVQLISPVDVFANPRITVRLVLFSGVVAAVTSLRMNPEAAVTREPIVGTGRLTDAMSRRYRVYTTKAHTLALEPLKFSQRQRRAIVPFAPRIIAALEAARGRTRQRKPLEDPLDARIYAALRRLPLRKNRVLVEAHMGRANTESPAVLAQAMCRLDSSLEIVRSAAPNADWPLRSNRTVVRGTLAYLRELATATYLIDNQTLPSYFVKRPGQVYIQTWHGIPLKKMGYDTADSQMQTAAEHAVFQARTDAWDYITVPSEYFRRTFIPAFRVQAQQLPLGTPRNDELVNADAGARAHARACIGIAEGTRAVLYAPTFRPGQAGQRAQELELDYEEWDELLPDDTIMLVRAHYLTRIEIPREYRHRFIDVSSIPDANVPMLASDLLITDFSSIMFDYLCLDRPIVIYAEDFDEYATASRGTYFDLRQTPPGPICEDVPDLMRAVAAELESDAAAEIRRAFAEAYAGDESGNAADASAAAILKGVR